MSHDRGSGGGNFILVEIFTSPGIHLTVYYCRIYAGSSSVFGVYCMRQRNGMRALRVVS